MISQRPRYRKTIISLVVALMVGVGVTVVGWSHAGSAVIGPLVPASGIYLGMDTTSTIDAREALVGRTLYIEHKFYAWTDDFFSAQYSGWSTTDAAKGRVRLVTWEPHTATLSAITSGSQDANIIAHADEAKAYGKPFFLRFAHEMNGNWYEWGAQPAADYIAAWKHIYVIFQQRGATNAIFTWCPNNISVPATNTAASYYPGDAYVGWICVDGYNFATNGGWVTPDTVFDNFYNTFATSGKPIMIGETSSAEVGGSKPDWINALRTNLKTKWPSIKALVWFDENKEADWRIDSSAATLTAWKALALDPYFAADPNMPSSTGTSSTAPSISPTPSPAALTGDTNADAKVDIFDLSYLLAHWGAADAKADYNLDGTVNVTDLSLLLSHWT